MQALERAQDEVRASRKYIEGLESSLESKESIIKAQTSRQTLSDEAIRLLRLEIEQLQAIIKNNEAALKIQSDEIVYLKKELSATNKKLGRARRLNKYLIITTVAVIALKAIFK